MPRRSRLGSQNLRDIPPSELFQEPFKRDLNHHGFAVGGRGAALEALAVIDPLAYGRDRSTLDGSVSRLSPYLRYGVLTLSEVRDAALKRVPTPSRAWKFINELSWRDYFQRVYGVIADGIWENLEPYKTGLTHTDYSQDFPTDIAAASTGANCIDAWSTDLQATGYLHNHVRMWLSSYIIHHRRVAWQSGARWFLMHLLDGDPASNNLSWQWVASTWRAYPYLWNRRNLVKYAGERYCETCPLREGGCPFDATYKALSERLFPDKGAAAGERGWLEQDRLAAVPWEPPPVSAPVSDAVVWVHGDRLSPLNEALVAYRERPAIFVWDDDLLAEWAISAKRLTFLHECVADLPVQVTRGKVAAQLIAFAKENGTQTIATASSPSPRFVAIVRDLEGAGLTVQQFSEPVFARSLTPLDLRIHAAYWGQVRASAFGREPGPPKPKHAKPRAKKKVKKAAKPAAKS
jgi:deoxyribodipyrimidine photo-lyase